MAWSGPAHLNNYLEPSPGTDEDIKTGIQLKQQRNLRDKNAKDHTTQRQVTTSQSTVDFRFY